MIFWDPRILCSILSQKGKIVETVGYIPTSIRSSLGPRTAISLAGEPHRGYFVTNGLVAIMSIHVCPLKHKMQCATCVVARKLG